MKKYAIIVAGGTGTRMGAALPKQFLPLCGRPILMHTLEKFATTDPHIQLVLVLPQAWFDTWQDLCRAHHFQLPYTLAAGGDTRVHSVQNGLACLPDDIEALVAIHDAVRPLVSREIIRQSYTLAADKGTAITVVSLKDSIREKIDDNRSQSRDRSRYMLVQTPQTFRLGLIKSAYCQTNIYHLTDDASVAENAGHTIQMLEGSYENIKITTPEDMRIAEGLWAGE